MRQSVIVALSPKWNIAAIGQCLEPCVDLDSLDLKIFSQQIEIYSQGEACVIVEALSDQDPETGYDNKGEIISDPHLDEQFRRDVLTLHLFAIDYKDLEIARHVLRYLTKAVVNTGDISWIDISGGISGQDFLARIAQDPKWDWRQS